ncbi:cell division initiation protein [Natranaerovirga hydrolytica]|uniref:Cell division initiation protein n=1 Tax=Natranaerovirga hydrolytica TaxID=680378 RepID=A0A4R1MY20_9FIRM|nr:DivIVA domain-containing protein [Natranaerovirga hydrolytica]TCK98106.1 cell division initiation protein [Natranaerovirga hydrolytica]
MLTPLDIETKTFKKMGMGYHTKDVDQFLKAILEDYEKIYKENIELKDKINVLNEGISYYKTIEETIQNTLVIAEKTAEDIKSNANEKAEHIKKEAELKANSILQDSQNELHKVENKIEEMRRIHKSYKKQLQQFLRTQLELVEEEAFSPSNEKAVQDIIHPTTNDTDEMNEVESVENSNE